MKPSVREDTGVLTNIVAVDNGGDESPAPPTRARYFKLIDDALGLGAGREDETAHEDSKQERIRQLRMRRGSANATETYKMSLDKIQRRAKATDDLLLDQLSLSIPALLQGQHLINQRIPISEELAVSNACLRKFDFEGKHYFYISGTQRNPYEHTFAPVLVIYQYFNSPDALSQQPAKNAGHVAGDDTADGDWWSENMRNSTLKSEHWNADSHIIDKDRQRPIKLAEIQLNNHFMPLHSINSDLVIHQGQYLFYLKIENEVETNSIRLNLCRYDVILKQEQILYHSEDIMDFDKSEQVHVFASCGVFASTVDDQMDIAQVETDIDEFIESKYILIQYSQKNSLEYSIRKISDFENDLVYEHKHIHSDYTELGSQT